MPGFTKDALRTPFGVNVYLRSTRDVKTESYTVYKESVPAIAVDGVNQKQLDKGVVMARIVSGAGLGKIGPFQSGGVTNEVVSIAVDAGGGTWTATWGAVATGAIPYNATAAAVKAAMVAAWVVGVNDILVTGGPGVAGGATPYVIEFTGDYGGQDVGAITTGVGSLTGGASTAAVTVSTAGSAGTSGGATDGRENPDNIVGFNNTHLPWQFLERDVEVAIVYEASVVQAWCKQLNAGGTAYAVIAQATANAMRNGPACSILFK